MTKFDINELVAAAKTALAEQQNGQDFLLSDVHNITRQAYERYAEDPIIRQFAFVIERKSEREGSSALISQAEMTNIYNEISRLGDTAKFRDALGMFLNVEGPKAVQANDDFVRMNRLDAETSQLSTEDYIDQDLANALQGAFGGSMAEQKTYNDKAAAKGAEFLQLELESMGFKPRVEVIGGNQETLVYAAHLDTQKGIVSVAIPLDVSQGKVLLPSTFVADHRLEELTATNLGYFIDKKAYLGDFSMPDANTVLKAVGIMTGRDVKASDEDFNSTLERFDERGEVVHLSTPELFSDKQNSEPKPYIDTTPDVEMPKELAHLARDFEDDLLEAASAFGRKAVHAGKEMLRSELAVAGFKNAQVRYGAENEDTIVYRAAIHTPRGPGEFEVAVEMYNGGQGNYVPLAPTKIAWQGETADFTVDNLQRFATARANYDGPVTSAAHAYMTLPELREEIIRAAGAGNYNACEMILGTIAEKFDESAYKNVVADYHHALTLKQSHLNKEERTCSKVIEAGKGSIEPRCGHFGLPMSKVVVSDDGHCRLKSAEERDRLNPANEGGASISTSKLILT